MSVEIPGKTRKCEYSLSSVLKIFQESVKSQCRPCNWIDRYRLINKEALSLLRNMGGEIIAERVPFPMSLYASIEEAQSEVKIRFLQETTEEIIDLFDRNLEAVTWDKRKVDNFLNVLDRQSRGLKACLESSERKPAEFPYERRLSRYFRKLRKNILKRKNYSAESWEQIRKTVETHLLRLEFIAAALKEV
ncbi:interferon a3-like [Chanos chanos]|uniref:Interferon a3-like n=1 Tax=Chanos chanos TaxID=29144 RepID=A0A6J2WY29_CHACN|nr:interferon a3-like [Chanos chanos]